MEAYRKEIFIIEWITLPQEQKDYVAYILDDRIANGVLIKWPTEFEPYDEMSFMDTLTTEHVEKYWKDQCKTNNFKGNLDDFIKEYGLKFDVWMIKQNFDLKGIKEIYISIDW